MNIAGALRLGLLAPLLVWLVVFTGCLPGGSFRESGELFPEDSLSRRIAADAPRGALVLTQRIGGTPPHRMELPHTVQFSGDGTIHISDTRRNSIFQFAPSGQFVAEYQLDAVHPYIVGSRGDSLAVMSRGTNELLFLVDGAAARRIPLPSAPYVATLVTEEHIFYKGLGEDLDGFVSELDPSGLPIEPKATLPGPFWRHIGMLRKWDDRVVSLSGFRPVVDFIGQDGIVDTVALAGFDSPMLARSRLFALGRQSQAPLLTSSAVPLDSLLFVLNLRPGWVRIDVYNEQGELKMVLEPEDQEMNTQFYPLDLSVRRSDSGEFEFAVITESPRAELLLLRWSGLDEEIGGDQGFGYDQ